MRRTIEVNKAEAPKPKPPRSDEERRVIEEYADDLREIIKKLRSHLN